MNHEIAECLIEVFPNFTIEMYEGNIPSCKGHEHINGGYTDKWSTRYGGGESYNGEIICCNFAVSKTTTIHIAGESLHIFKNLQNKTVEYTNDGISIKGLLLNVYEMDTNEVEKIINMNFDCEFWKMVQKKAKQLYNSNLALCY